MTLNGEDLDYTVVGRATGTSDIIGMSIITTTSENSILTVRNLAGTALTITPLAGGTRPVWHIWSLHKFNKNLTRSYNIPSYFFTRRKAKPKNENKRIVNFKKSVFF